MQFNGETHSKILEIMSKIGVTTPSRDVQSTGLPTHNTSSTNRTSSIDEGTLDIEALDNDFINRPGLSGICSLQRQDKMYMACPLMTEPSMFCVSILASRLFRQFSEVLEATEAKDAGLEEMETKLIAVVERYHNLVEKIRATQAFVKPNKSLVRKFIKVFRFKLGEGKGLYLDHFMDDWGMLTSTQRLESWIRLLPESDLGKRFMSMFLEGKHKDEKASYRSYGESPFEKILLTALISLVAVFCAVPMVILGRNLVGSAAGVSISVGWLFVFSLLLLKIVPDEDMVLFLSVGYASLLCALMKDGSDG